MPKGNASPLSAFRDFSDHVRELSSVRRRRILVYWALALVIYGALAFVFLLLAGSLSGFSFVGMNGAAGVVALGLFWLFRGMIRSMLSGRRGGRGVIERYEKEHPETFDRLLTAQELATDSKNLDRLGYSRELADRTIQFADDYVRRLVNEELKRPPVEPPLAIIAGLVLFGAVLSMALPGGRETGRVFFASLGAWLQESAPPPPGEVFLIGPERVPRGESVDLSITVSNPKTGAVLHLDRRGNWERIPLHVQSDGRAVYTIPKLRERVACLVTAGALASRRLLVRPVDPPVVSQVSWRIRPPQYTRLPEHTMTGGLMDVKAPLGSHVDVNVRADQPLVAASWLLGDRAIPLEATGELARGSVRIFGASPFVFELTNDLGMISRSTTESISIVPDRPPKATILTPEQTANLDQSNRQEISALITDDYGIQRVLLCYEINYQEAQRATIELLQTAGGIDCPTQTTLRYKWDLEPFQLIPGDEVSYYIEVWDNDPFAQSKSGRSETHILRSPSLADVYQDLFADEVDQVDTMTGITEKQRSITKEAQDITKSALEKVEKEKAEENQKPSFFAEKQRLKNLQEKQKELQKELTTLQEKVGKMSDSDQSDVGEKAGLSMETLAKIERIQELMNQLVGQEGKKLLQQVQKIVDQMSNEVKPKDLKKMAFSFDKFEKNLDRTLSQLEAAYQVRQLEGLWRVAEEMADRQDRLKRDTARLEKQMQEKGKETPEVKRDHAALEQRQEALNQDAESMLRTMERLAEDTSTTRPGLSETLKQMAEMGRREMSQTMQKAQQNLSQNQLPQAQTAMNKAQQQMKKLASGLQEQFAGLGGLSVQMDLRRISRLIDRGLYLSNQQERLVDFPIASRQPRRSLELEVLYAREALRLSKAWKEIVATNPFADLSVIALLEAGAGGMRKAIEVSGKEDWIRYGPAYAALRNINDAVAAMLDTMNSLMQQAAQSNGEGFFQQMQKLIDQQKRLNQESDRLQAQQKSQKDLVSEIQRMARQQARIRKEIQDLMRRFRTMKNLQSRLDDVAKEMKEVEQQLQQAQLDRELAKKQNHILTRMLEAQTSQKQDMYGRRRKAERPTGREGISSPPDRIEPGKEREIRGVYEPAGSQFVPYRYRDLVKRYFRNLRQRESL